MWNRVFNICVTSIATFESHLLHLFPTTFISHHYYTRPVRHHSPPTASYVNPQIPTSNKAKKTTASWITHHPALSCSTTTTTISSSFFTVTLHDPKTTVGYPLEASARFTEGGEERRGRKEGRGGGGKRIQGGAEEGNTQSKPITPCHLLTMSLNRTLVRAVNNDDDPIALSRLQAAGESMQSDGKLTTPCSSANEYEQSNDKSSG